MEQTFTINKGSLRIPCRLRDPIGGNPRRVVLGVHGIGGSANDRIQTAMAEEMAMFHSAMLRFDFPAHGQSPLGSEYFSLKNCTDCLLAAAEEAKSRYPGLEDLCIFASGFGAYVTLIALDALLEMPGGIRLVIQTPSLRMHETLLAMARISRETFWAMDRYVFQTERPIEVTYRLYEELKDNVAMNTYPIPMLILQGEEDAFIRSEDIRSFNRINEDARLVIIPGASHRFQEEGAWDMVLDLVRDWFMYEDVLLCDWE